MKKSCRRSNRRHQRHPSRNDSGFLDPGSRHPFGRCIHPRSDRGPDFGHLVQSGQRDANSLFRSASPQGIRQMRPDRPRRMRRWLGAGATGSLMRLERPPKSSLMESSPVPPQPTHCIRKNRRTVLGRMAPVAPDGLKISLSLPVPPPWPDWLPTNCQRRLLDHSLRSEGKFAEAFAVIRAQFEDSDALRESR